MSVDWNDRCQALLEATETALAAAVGGSSLCAIGRRGERIVGVKYLEGRAAALRDVRRGLRDHPGPAVVDGLRAEWHGHLRMVRDRAMGPDWIDYRQGGVDVLVELASTDHGVDTPRGT